MPACLDDRVSTRGTYALYYLDTTLIALLEFPTLEEVQAFANDPDYAKYGQARRAGSIGKFNVIDDSDVAGTILYLLQGQQ